MPPELVILLVGAFVGISCALVGTFLVFRRMSLLGDAISHAVLLGIVVAFLVATRRDPIPMFVGAAAVGLLTAFLVEVLHRTRRLYEDASIGVVFPALFSIGVILVSRYAEQVHLDLDCVLYGEIAFAPLDPLLVGDRSWGPKALWTTGAAALLNLALVLLLYKELKVSTFDPALAAAVGISPVVVHYVLMTAVALTVVGAFESVGAILVVAFLVVPPAAAHLLTDRLSATLVLASAIGVVSAAAGYALAAALDVSIAGGMATAAGAIFAAVFLVAPEHGLMARAIRRRRLSMRLAGGLLLTHLGGRPERSAVPEEDLRARFRWTGRRFGAVLRALDRQGLVRRVDGAGGGLTLTEAGAALVSRAEREGLPVHALAGR